MSTSTTHAQPLVGRPPASERRTPRSNRAAPLAQGVVTGARRWYRPAWLTPRRLAVAAAVVLALGFLAYQYRNGIDASMFQIRPHWGWAGLALLGVVASQAGNAWNLMGASPVRLSFGRTLAAQFGGTLTRVVSPSAVGAAAVNAQYLRRAGTGSVAAVGAVSVAQSVQLVSALAMLPVVAAVSSQGMGVDMGSPLVWAIAAAAVVLLAGAAVLIIRRYPLLEAWARFAVRELTKSVRVMATEPAKAALSLFGAFVISAGLIFALWASVHAFGGELSLGLAAFILLVGSTAGNAVPVPGGIGTVEAVLVAALGTIAGVPAAVALPAVALFRLLTLWLQLPVGLACVAALRRVGAL